MNDFTGRTQLGTVGVRAAATAAADEHGWLYIAASVLIALYFAFFLSGILSYVGTQVPGTNTLLSVPFYLFYALAAGRGLVVLVRDASCRARVGRLALLGAWLLLPVALGGHVPGVVGKSYIVTIGSMLLFTSVALAADTRRLGLFASAVVVISSLLVLADGCFVNGFTITLGRPAGLFMNPNVAAFTLMLGATGSLWAVPSRWRLALCVLVIGAVFSTLSRGAMALGMITLLACVPSLRSRWSIHREEWRAGCSRALAATIVVILLLGGALALNRSFGVAMGDAFHGFRNAYTEWRKVQSRLAQIGWGGHKGEALEGEPEMIEEAVAELERSNSISARGLLFQRSLYEYRRAPALGRGLEYAFDLAPHNSYLLFAVAFGHIGWGVVLALVAFILTAGGWRRGLPAAVLVAGGAFLSHDLLLAVPMVAALVVLLSSLLANPAPSSNEPAVSATRTVRFALTAVVVALFVMSGLALYAQSRRLRTYEFVIPADSMIPVRGEAFYVTLPPPVPRGLLRMDGEKIVLTESGVVLGPSQARAEVIQTWGSGRYDYQNLGLLFSSSDGSIPGENGKVYRVLAPMGIHPLFVIVVTAFLGWAITCILALWQRQRR